MKKKSKKAGIRSVAELALEGLIQEDQTVALEKAARGLPVSIPQHVLEAMKNEDAFGPLYKQFVPSGQENLISPEEVEDPIGDIAFSPTKGIVHRYPDRVLLNLLKSCAVYCRFCFRRDFVGKGQDTLNSTEQEAALEYIGRNKEIWEVILSGGDPLILAPRRLKELSSKLVGFSHVKILRVHTRLPIADPKRISDELLEAIKCSGKTVIMGVHVNHPSELTPQALVSLNKIGESGMTLLGQTVLLKGVNDSCEVLGELFRQLVEAGVQPYYLHHPDLVRGTSHFRVSIKDGQRIMEELRGNVSGTCLPTYILDIPGGFGKVPIGPNYLTQNDGQSGYRVKDVSGNFHSYPNN